MDLVIDCKFKPSLLHIAALEELDTMLTDSILNTLLSKGNDATIEYLMKHSVSQKTAEIALETIMYLMDIKPMHLLFYNKFKQFSLS